MKKPGYNTSIMILVADSDSAFLEKALKILNRDRQVLLASTASQAYELARTLGVSVALVDLDLPGDSLGLIERLHRADPDLPIIAISSAFNEQVLKKVKRFGVVEILNKPITPDWKPIVERFRSMRRKS